MLLDGATVISPFRLDTDRTISSGRFDPFMLKGVHFSAGGFGAEYGDALSAVADLQTVDRPDASELELTTAIGGLSGRLHLNVSESFGTRVTGTYTNTGLLMRMNGRRDEFDQVPRSTDLSGGFEWAYGDEGSLNSFAMLQTDHVGVRIDDPAYSGTYRSDGRADLVALSGLDSFGGLGLSWGLRLTTTPRRRLGPSSPAWNPERGWALSANWSCSLRTRCKSCWARAPTVPRSPVA